jgi:hypothetical protein
MSPNRTLARGRRMAAVHEAGHVVIARRVGFKTAVAWIWPNEGRREERSWLGRTLLQKGPQVDDLSRRMVGVAGSIAEHLWHGGWIGEYLPQEEMSESDWRMAGCVPNEPDDVLDECNRRSRPAARARRFGMASAYRRITAVDR